MNELQTQLTGSDMLMGLFLPIGIVLMFCSRVRFRNEIDAALRMFCTVAIGLLCFWAIGFGLAFGNSLFGFSGTTLFGFSIRPGEVSPQKFLHYAILSVIPSLFVVGAMMERGRLSGSMLLAAAVSVFVVPLVFHWTWAETPTGTGWLAVTGFQDPGGSLVVFGTAGWCALAVSVVLGPRLGRFNAGLSPIRGRAPTITMLGMWLFILGKLALDTTFGAVPGDDMEWQIIVALLAASAGVSIVMIGTFLKNNFLSPGDWSPSALSALIAVSAVGYEVSPILAIIIGAVAGVLRAVTRNILEHYEIDDIGNMISMALIPGTWGVLIVPFLVVQEPGNFNLFNLLGGQVLGLSVVGIWSFSIVFVLAGLLNRTGLLRVNLNEEQNGLDLTHFGSNSEPAFALRQVSRTSGNLHPYDFDLKSELSTLLQTFNGALQEFQLDVHDAGQRTNLGKTGDIGSTAAIQLAVSFDAMRLAAEEVNLLIEQIVRTQENSGNSISEKAGLMSAIRLILEQPVEDVGSLARRIRLEIDSDELESYVRAANAACGRLNGKLNSVLQLIDILQSGAPALQHVDPVALLEKISPKLKIQAEALGTTLNMSVESSPGMIQGHPLYLAKLLNSLVELSLSRSDGVSSVVNLEIRDFGDGVLFEILDTGPVLPARALEALDEPFSRIADDLDIRDLDTIISVALINQLVRLQEGTVQFKSEVGVGTQIVVRLPYFEDQETA
ncbi:MAG: hypothetical protein COB90_02475 [Hyphomicrobiales bacterium]|nr:MAG: hypothetical protein COB90_02475 [Hyphomicrobiales bacterium]